jgi:hypothetical protein
LGKKFFPKASLEFHIVFVWRLPKSGAETMDYS